MFVDGGQGNTRDRRILLQPSLMLHMHVNLM